METSEMAPIVIYLVLCVFSFFLNGTFLIVICKNWTLVKRRRITYHVTNLAIADFLVGVGEFGHFISIIAAGRQTTFTIVFMAISWTAVLTSLLSVCLMAIERTICIKKPHTWNQILPLKRIFIIMAGIWLLALALVILFNFYTLTMRFVFAVLIYMPICATTVVYARLYRKIWKTMSNETHEESQKSSAEAIKERRDKLLQQKVGTFVLILTMVMLITMSPILLTLTVKTACELFELNCTFMETINTLERYSYLMSMMNFVVNPIIYAWRISMYRKAFWKMFGRADIENS